MTDTNSLVAMLAGASGFVGGRVLDALLDAPEVARVLAVTRRPLGREHPRLANRIVQFDHLERQLAGLKCQVALCCLGARLGEREGAEDEAIRRVDLGYTLAFARAAKAAGAARFVVISAAGADVAAKSGYLRIKGELEEMLAGVGFGALDILQPAIVLGWPREMAVADLVRRAMMPLVNPFLVGARTVNRGIPVGTAAAAMLGTLRSGRRGAQRYTYAGICALAQLRPRRPAALVAATS
ncbi:MAG: NAD(P)H-binding protein [Gammaproteobacteria bacterium]|nr:NAD(P)H-binding protein [Gammaproteobacteria bacterium]